MIDGSELPKNPEEAYAAVLDNKMKLSGRLSGEYLGNYLEKNELSIRKTAVLDLDGDGGVEMVLWLGTHTNDSYGFLILHHENDMVYAYDEPYRDFNDLKADGTYYFSSGVSNNGIGRLQFANGLCTTVRLAYCKSADNTNVFYYIDDKSVTRDEYNAFTSQQSAKEDAPWVDYSVND